MDAEVPGAQYTREEEQKETENLSLGESTVEVEEVPCDVMYRGGGVVL